MGSKTLPGSWGSSTGTWAAMRRSETSSQGAACEHGGRGRGPGAAARLLLGGGGGGELLEGAAAAAGARGRGLLHLLMVVVVVLKTDRTG